MSQHILTRSAGVEIILERREAIKKAVLLAVGMILGKLDTVHAGSGVLTVDLDQWHHVRFKLGGKIIDVGVQEIFDALRG